MSANLIFALTFLATFGGLVGLYALAKSYRDAARRLDADRLYRATRPSSAGASHYIGGSNRPGEN